MKKLYYTLKEIAELLGEEKHTLRYWVKQFTTLKPKRSKTGTVLYSQKQLEELQFIQNKIRTEEVTTTGLKKWLTNKDKKTELLNNEKLIYKYKDLLTNMENKIMADDIVMLSKSEFREMLELLQILFACYLNDE